MAEMNCTQIEDAIRRELHICGRYRTPIGGPSYEYPVAFDALSVTLRDGDCGLVKPTRSIPIDEWVRLAEGGLWRRVGMWSFVLDSDPAADEIAQCERFPHSAGRELHRLREEVARLRAVGGAPPEDVEEEARRWMADGWRDVGRGVDHVRALLARCAELRRGESPCVDDDSTPFVLEVLR